MQTILVRSKPPGNPLPIGYSIYFVMVAYLMLLISCGHKQTAQKITVVSEETMKEIYEEIKTPYKYGVVFKHPDTTKLMDSPTIFRAGNRWYMTYIVFDGQGYETYLAQSDDLLDWTSKGKILSYTQNTWDANQKAGYVSLVDITWGGDYTVSDYRNTYWLSYLGGATEGYEAGTLAVGMATSRSLTEAIEWNRMNKPVLAPSDSTARWFDNLTIYKSLIIEDEKRLTGYPFVMYYNAKGKEADYESIAMAVSEDMTSWKRMGDSPVITRKAGICGDAQIAKINELYVMFYFGAFWKPGAFDRFACSYDLIHWTDWKGGDLVTPSEAYDSTYAHKPWVIKWKGTVYHFYTAVGSQGRVIALATSKDLRSSQR